MEALLFYSTAVVMVAAAGAAMLQRSAVHTALLLVVVFCGFGLLYLLCGAQVIAAIQVIVYAGAIMAVFVFILFYVGSMPVPPVLSRLREFVPLALLALVTGAGLLSGFGYMLRRYQMGAADPVGSDGSAEAFGVALFSAKYLLPVEIASLILVVGMIAAVVLILRPAPLSLGAPADAVDDRGPQVGEGDA